MTSSTTEGLTPSSSRGTAKDSQQSTALDLQVNLEALRLEEKKKQWISWVDEQYIRAKNQRNPFERQWFLNLAFIAGRQYVSPINVPGQGFRLTSPKVPPWRVRLVINLIRKAVRKECAKLTSSKPIPTVVPATNEDEDQTAAQVAEQVLKAQFANAKYEEIYRRWIWWGVSCGTAFIKSYYDPSAPDYDAMSLPEPPEINGMPFPQELIDNTPELAKLKEYLETPQPARGKICFTNVSPFHIYVPDLMSESLEDQPFLIHVLTKSPQWVRDRFGFEPQADARASITILDAANIITKGMEGQSPDAVLVKECWIKPGAHPDFPEGGMLTIINEKIVQLHTKWPCPFPEFPYYQYRGIPTGGFYDDSVVVDLIPMQKEYNRTRSQIIEIKNVMGKPKILYPKGSINPRMISSEPGQSIPYEQGYDQPIIMQGVEVPVSMINEVEQLRTEFDDISGQHDISNGQTPAGVTSGTAIAYLEEQDASSLSYQVAGIELAQQMLGTHYLKYVTKYWQNDRIIRVSGNNNAYESIHWKKNSIEGNTDVRVQTGSALPTSKAAKQALITEMMQNGFMSPEVGLEILDFGSYEKAMEDYLVDKRQAMRENLKMQEASDSMLELLMSPTPDQHPVTDSQGRTLVFDPEAQAPMPMEQEFGQGPVDDEGNPPLDPNTGAPQQTPKGAWVPFQPQPPIPVNSWDNHEAHIQWHNMYRKSQQFEQLSPIKKQAFELHVQTHELAIQFAQVNLQGLMLQPGAGVGNPMGADAEQQMPAEAPPSGPQGSGEGQISEPTESMQENYNRDRASDSRANNGSR